VTVIAHSGNRRSASASSVLARQHIRPGSAQRSRIEATSAEPRRFPFELNDGTITVEVYGDEPDWLYSILNKIQAIATLAPNWDSYGGETPTFEAALAALSFLAEHLSDSAVSPAVVPASSGGVQLEWHRHAGDLEVLFSPDGSMSAFFVDALSNAEWEMEVGRVDADQLMATVKTMTAPIAN